MRALATHVLLLLLLLQSCGALWLHSFVVQPYCHYVAQHHPQPSICLRLSLADTAQLQWKHAHEFLYYRQMYDLHYSERTADSLFLWVHADRLETHWMHLVEQYWANLGNPITDAPAQNKAWSFVLKCLLLVYITANLYKHMQHAQQFSLVCYSRIGTLQTLHYPSIITPPPQFLLY